MKYRIAIIFAAICIETKAQSIEFKLSGVAERKWFAESSYDNTLTSCNGFMQFKHNHYLTIEPDKNTNHNKLHSWRVAKGFFLTDSVVIVIDNTAYNVEFLQSSLGKDMMVLTKVPVDEDEALIRKTFYAE